MSYGEIDSAGFFPSEDGVGVSRDSIISVLGGSSIVAEVQMKSGSGRWFRVPSPSNSEISGDYAQPIQGAVGHRIRISVSSVTGTWDWTISEKAPR